MKDYSKPVGEILDCHREILAQAEKLEASLSKFRSGGAADDMRLSLDVFLLFAKTTLYEHKADEEMSLFPFLIESGLPQDQVASFIRDHDEIREIAGLAQLAKKAAKEPAEDFGRELSDALRGLKGHMEEEEKVIRSAACRTKGAGKLCTNAKPAEK